MTRSLKMASVLLAVVHASHVSMVTAASQRPHIVMILADDLGNNDVSFHGSMQIPTPNIDNLAYSGVILNNYYVSPICTPTRSALMTGRYPIHTGMQVDVIVGSQPYGLPLNHTIMPQHLKKLGYRTHMAGKWHLGFHKKEYTPTYRGFESFVGYYQGCGDYYGHSYEANETEFGYDFRRNTSLDYTSIGEYSTTIFTREAVNVISNHNEDEPLFLYLPYQAVHSGNIPSGNYLQAPTTYINRHPHILNEERKHYAGMMAALDDGVGAVVKALRNKGLCIASHAVGVKGTLWEGGVRGAGFIHSPLLSKSAYKAEQLMHVCDWLPTLYSAAGGSPNNLGLLDGVDMWRMLTTNGQAVRTELLHNIDPVNKNAALRVGDYKLIIGKEEYNWDGWYPPFQAEEDSKLLRYDNPAAKNIRRPQINFSKTKEMVTDSRSSIFRDSPAVVHCGDKPANASTNCVRGERPCLYHIPSDPCEYNNIADQNPDLVAKIMKRLDEYESTMVPPGNILEDPKGNPRLNKGAWVSWLDQ